jgi:tetratricopeptide (TPR) repeat protein
MKKSSFGIVAVAATMALAVTLSGCGSAQTRKAKYLQHGQEYLSAANFDKARVEFRNAAQIDPKDAQVHYFLAQVAEKSGDLRAAVSEYQVSIGADAKYAAPRAALGRLYLIGALADKAMELIEPGLVLDPGNAQLLTVRAAARERLGDKPGALSDAEQAVRLAPDDEYGLALLASLYRQRAQPAKAIELVRQSVQRLPKATDLRVILADLLVHTGQNAEAEAQLRQLVSLDPASLEHRYQLAKLYLLLNKPDAAEGALREAVKVAAGKVEPKLQLLQFLQAQRGPERALAEVDAMSTAAAHDSALKLALAQFLAQNGQGDRSAALLRRVVQDEGSKPDGLAARDRLAALLVSKRDLPAAKSLVAEVLKSNGRDNDALVLRSSIALAEGNAEAAIADLRAVLRDQPNSVPVLRALAQAYQRNGENDLAGEAIRNAVQLAPQDVASRLDLAQLLVGEKNLDSARPLLEQLAKDEPLNVQVQWTLFNVQLAQQQYAAARTTAEAILKVRPDIPLGHYLAGVSDEQNNQPAKAEREYDQALKVQPAAGEPLAAVTRLEVRGKQAGKALQRLDALISSQPTSGLARELKAETLIASGRTGQAMQALAESIKVLPQYPQFYSTLASLQLQATRADAAVATLQQGIATTHSAAPLVSALAAAYQQLGRADDAVKLYEDVLAHDPRALYAANNLAMLLITVRSDPASLAQAQKLAEQLVNSPAVNMIDTRGWVKYKSGDFKVAQQLLQQAVDKSPQEPELRYHLGMAQMRNGTPAAAVLNLEAAVAAKTPFTGIDEARAALAQARKTTQAG